MTALRQLGAKGFRPFFLLAGSFAVLVVPLWVGSLWGGAAPRGALIGVTWHAHEMIFGFLVAVIAGFLLTSVEAWTGRPTLRGPWLLAAAALWLSARVALWFGFPLASALDLAFLPLLIAGIAGPLVHTRNVRNLPFLVLLGALWFANLAVHLDATGVWPGAAASAHRAAVSVVAVIILVVAGRVVPLFTRNSTGDASVRSIVFLDRLAIGSTVLLAVAQLSPPSAARDVLSVVAGLATLARMGGWWTREVATRPLLWVLHLGHAAVGLGLLLTELHLITVGGAGLLTIGMMTRVSLGHTGRTRRVDGVFALAFGAIALAAVVRVVGPWWAPTDTLRWLAVAAVLWSGGFAAFVTRIGPMLVAPRPDGKPG